MKKFINYFSEKEITSYLCNKRVKISQKRNKQHSILNLTKKKQYNYHGKKQSKDEMFLSSMMPPRRKWIKLKDKSRYKDGHLIDTTKKNYKSLMLTINSARKNNSSEEWLSNLTDFIKKINSDIFNFKLKLNRPHPLPIVKKKDDTDTRQVCRPICTYNVYFSSKL